MKSLKIFAIACMLILGAQISNVSADPYCHACPFSCADLGLGRKDCSQINSSAGTCCVDLTKTGLRIAQERDRAQASTCPPGFSPSEQKCSQEERRRGCKDVRMPSGLGCVRR